MEDYDVVRRDFNEIAELEEPKWNHNNCYYKEIIKMIPDDIDTCLDIGCGKGELSFLLSKKAKKVIAVDIAEKMIEKAKTLNPSNNIEYICDNILNMRFEDNSLDAIVTSATAHHLPYDWLLCFAKDKLKNGGKLIILDLVKASFISDYLIWGSAFIPNIIMNLLRNGRINKDEPQAKEVWERHGKNDKYMTLGEIKALANKYLPNAKIKRKLFWRYFLIWQK